MSNDEEVQKILARKRKGKAPQPEALEVYDERSWFRVDLEAINYEATEEAAASSSWEVIRCDHLAMAESEDGQGMTAEVSRKGARFSVFLLALTVEEAIIAAVEQAGSPEDATQA